MKSGRAFFLLFVTAGLIVLTQCTFAQTEGAESTSDPHALTVSPLPSPSDTPSPGFTAPAEVSTTSPAPIITPAPTITTPENSPGKVLTEEIPSLILSEPITAQVYLPPDYQDDNPTGYPLLILLHGLGYNSSQWVRLGVPETADRLIQKGDIPPVIILMPEEAHMNTGYKDGRYDEAILNDILPWARSVYPICPERTCTAIGGLSRGAAWASLLGFEHWDIFGNVGLHSIPGTLSELPALVRVIPPGQKPRVFMDIGQQDVSFQEAVHFGELLAENYIIHTLSVQPGEHDEKYWSAQTETYLRWYSESWDNQ